MKIGDKMFVRDGWITASYMVPQGTVVEIGYEKNSTVPMVVLIQWDSFHSGWFHIIALKQQ